jgi:hypothetical protein
VAAMLFVGRNDALHERMADDIAFAKFDNGNAFGVLEGAMRLE